MSNVIIAGLMDSPWLVAVILLVGALANWLSSRRLKQNEAKEAAPRKEGEPQEEFDMEETLRRLLGQETDKPAGPPPIPRTSQSQPPPIRAWIEEDDQSPEHEWMEADRPAAFKPAQPPPVAWIDLKPSVIAGDAVSATTPVVSAAPSTGVALGRRTQHSRTGARQMHWRNPKKARQAFVASLVFGTPKGLEA